MTVGELLKKLEGMPKNTIVYVEADHGQTPIRANGISVLSKQDSEGFPWNGEDLNWRSEGSLKRPAAINIY